MLSILFLLKMRISRWLVGITVCWVDICACVFVGHSVFVS